MRWCCHAAKGQCRCALSRRQSSGGASSFATPLIPILCDQDPTEEHCGVSSLPSTSGRPSFANPPIARLLGDQGASDGQCAMSILPAAVQGNGDKSSSAPIGRRSISPAAAQRNGDKSNSSSSGRRSSIAYPPMPKLMGDQDVVEGSCSASVGQLNGWRSKRTHPVIPKLTGMPPPQDLFDDCLSTATPLKSAKIRTPRCRTPVDSCPASPRSNIADASDRNRTPRESICQPTDQSQIAICHGSRGGVSSPRHPPGTLVQACGLSTPSVQSMSCGATEVRCGACIEPLTKCISGMLRGFQRTISDEAENVKDATSAEGITTAEETHRSKVESISTSEEMLCLDDAMPQVVFNDIDEAPMLPPQVGGNELPWKELRDTDIVFAGARDEEPLGLRAMMLLTPRRGIRGCSQDVIDLQVKHYAAGGVHVSIP